MSATKDGGAAFPNEAYDGRNNGVRLRGGMSLRDYFAAAALPAVIAATSAGQHMLNVREGETVITAIARDAFDLADAMLNARQQNGGEHDR